MCGGRGGPCPQFCGTNGLCCRRGWTDDGCDKETGGESYHTCIQEKGQQMKAVDFILTKIMEVFYFQSVNHTLIRVEEATLFAKMGQCAK